jgi:hypothetical protein
MNKALDAVFALGTLLSCPSRGEGLYKLVKQRTTEDVVLDDGTLLVPLNRTIPPRNAWMSLACPLCGERLFKEGRLHSLQQGWR